MNVARDISIARVIARLNVGGPTIQAVLMTDELSRRGYSTMLLTGEVPPGEASMEYLATSKGVEVIKLDSMSRRISLGRDLVSLWRLWRIFRQQKPTVVHTHTAKAGTLGRLAAILAGVPIRVHTFHGHVFSGYFSWPVTRLFLTIERQLARHTDCIVAISESQKRELSEDFRIASADRIEVVPLGFELEPFLSIDSSTGLFRSSLSCTARTPLVGWIGRFAPVKAPALFIDCAAECSSSGVTAHFVMVGDGNLRRSCEAQIDRLELNGVLETTGWRRDLPTIHADLDLIVSTSISEGTPVALLEAMAAAKPFIATDVGGTRDLMVGAARSFDGMEVFDNAILVPRNHYVLAHAIRYLLDRPELALSMGRAGREFVRSRFSAQRLADDLERLYMRSARDKGILPDSRESVCTFPVQALGTSETADN